MPNINTHIAFTEILHFELSEKLENSYFLLGNIAPDCFLYKNNNYLNCKAHYKNDINNNCQCKLFLKDKCFNVTNEEKSFILGYYSHLWLDNYFTNNEHILRTYVTTKDNTVRKKSFSQNLLFYDNKIINNKLNIDEINSTVFKYFKNHYVVSEKDMKKIFNDCIKLFEESVNYKDFLVLDEEKYINFLNLASSKLLKDIEKIQSLII
ncbi:hypothetical protein UT300018_18500 [Clostridium faecium]